MSLEAGQTLSHYRLIEKIGEGGMGVVWKALDTTPRPRSGHQDPARGVHRRPRALARFEREAKLLASLNHPNIATVYGLHEADGVSFIAMELVPGKTLAERLARGAHAGRRGPGAGTPDRRGPGGRPRERRDPPGPQAGEHHGHRETARSKVLDFGLAKSSAGTGGGERFVIADGDLRRNAAGVILGTAAYMSPEQARGKPLDRRTDIWSFGCVLYEMLTGKRCFGGETASDILARILEREPDWDALPAGDAGGDPRSCCDAACGRSRGRGSATSGRRAITIEDLQADRSRRAARPPRRPDATHPWAHRCPDGGLRGVVGWMVRRPGPPLPRAPARLVVSLPQKQQLGIADDARSRSRRTARRVVYGASSPPGTRLVSTCASWIDSRRCRFPGPRVRSGPFFSPDSRWLGYFADGKLYKIAVEGGHPVEICHVGQAVPGASWGQDDRIFFSDSPAPDCSGSGRRGNPGDR